MDHLGFASLETLKDLGFAPGAMTLADIPLTDSILAILREIQATGIDNKLVFPGLKRGQTCSNNTMLKLLKADMGRNATVHGFRSTFRT